VLSALVFACPDTGEADSKILQEDKAITRQLEDEVMADESLEYSILIAFHAVEGLTPGDSQQPVVRWCK